MAISSEHARIASPRTASAEPDAWTIVGVVADVREEYAYRPVPPVDPVEVMRCE